MTNKQDSVFHMQAEFLKAGEVPFPLEVTKATATQVQNMINLVDEEISEWHDEIKYLEGGDINDLKEAADAIYTLSQYLNQSVGPDKALAIYQAVHANNMGKCIEGKLVKDEMGKIKKPEGFDKNAWRPVVTKIIGGE